jgi:hypothetical protein
LLVWTEKGLPSGDKSHPSTDRYAETNDRNSKCEPPL